MQNMDKIIVILLSYCLLPVACQDCGEGWEHYNNKCYRIELSESRSWHNAQDWCMEQGGDLASIENEAERNFLHSISDGINRKLWIGLNQLEDHNAPHFWSDGSTAGYRDWAISHPIMDKMHQCVYTELPYTHPGDCFSQIAGYSSIKGVIDSPSEAQPPNTWHFGSWSEDEEGIDLCMAECKKVLECFSYTFVSVMSSDPTWSGECIGVSDEFDVEVQDIWSYMGKRQPCESSFNSSALWYTTNCGAPEAFVCKRNLDAGGPITDPPPQNIDSYCPQGYFNLAGGNKCFKVFTPNHTNSGSGKTWDEALLECQSGPGINPTLASISNEVENAEILAALKDYVWGVWLGYFVDVRTEMFLWADNSNPVYENWDTDEPGLDEPSETCTQMWVSPGKPGTWASLNCGDRLGYVCQTHKDPDNIIDSPPNTTPFTCNSGWTPYWYSCYKLITEAKAWQAAEDHCVSDGGHLVSINSEIENSAVFAFTQDSGNIWTGFKKNENDKYVWSDNWMESYTNWAEGGTEGGEGCVEMLESGLWKDVECSQAHHFLCKYSDQTSLTTPPFTDGYCPQLGTWKQYGSHCYLFEVTGVERTWDEAEEACKNAAEQGFEPHLVSIHSHPENTMITDELNGRGVSEPTWIGLRRNSKEEAFSWSDGSALDFPNWAPGNPNATNVDVACAELVTHIWKGAWLDDACSARRKNHVCKADKASVTTPTTTAPPTTPTVPPPGSQECPSDDWVKYGNLCYLVNSNEPLSYEDAVNQCVTLSDGKATLASIHDYSENFFIQGKMQEGSKYWIGMYKEGGGECFTEEGGRDRITEVLDNPSSANPPDTFHFGKWTKNKNDAEALTWCIEQCRKIPGCYAYTFSSSLDGNNDQTWKGHCNGRSPDYGDESKTNFWFYSGIRIPCGMRHKQDDGYYWIDGKEVTYTNWSPDRDQRGNCVDMLQSSGQWNDVDCMAHQGYVCRWAEDGSHTNVPATPSTTITKTTTTDGSHTTITTTPSSGGTLCPDNSWLSWNGYCYYVSNSGIRNISSTWEDAQSYCKTINSNLVSIHSIEENYMIYQELKSAEEVHSAWIGLWMNNSEFTRHDFRTTLYGILDLPQDADDKNTFYFGGGSQHNFEWCASQCEQNPECAAFTWYEAHLDYNWEFTCVGRSDKWDILEFDSYGHSGIRQTIFEYDVVNTRNTFEWADGTPVNFTNWGPNEPITNQTEHICVDMSLVSNPSKWEGEKCFEMKPFICKTKMNDTKPPDSDRTQPQYQIMLRGTFQSSTGETFDQECTIQYAGTMNQKAIQMGVLVNSLIGTELCISMTTEQVKVITASSPMSVDGNMGETEPTFFLALGPNLLISEVESCAANITSFLLPHYNWGEPLLPTIPGCPGVEFDSNKFVHDQDQWMCAALESKKFQTASPLSYGISHTGNFHTELGDDLDTDCLNKYNTDFNTKTFEMVQTINGQIASGDLCNGYDVIIITASAFLVVGGNEGVSSQTYALEPSTNMRFSDVYSCADDISSYLSPHEHWGTPILPQIPGCPNLIFSPELFQETSQNWICIATSKGESRSMMSKSNNKADEEAKLRQKYMSWFLDRT